MERAVERRYILITLVTSLNKDGSCEEHQEGSLFAQMRMLDHSTVQCAKLPEDRNRFVVVDIPKSYLELLEPPEFELLLSIPAPERNRLTVWKDKQWLNEGLTLHVGSPVFICNHSQLSDGTQGVIRYKGPLPSRSGLWFGVELAPQYAGDGTTDGVFRRQRFFQCADDCGIFVSIYRVRNNEDVPLMHSRGYHVSPTETDIEDHVLKSFPFQKEDRVVWISSEDIPEAGTIKWIGKLPDSSDENIIVGVYFDNPVGSGTGRYKGEQLFSTPRGHASLMPPLGLIKYADFYGQSAENLSRRVDSLTIRGGAPENTSLETSPSSLTSRDPDIIVSSRTTQPTLTARGMGSADQPRPLAAIGIATAPLPYKFHIGQKVYISLKERRYGVIRYIGPHPKSKDRMIAGLEMDIEDPKSYTDGEFAGEKLFHCRPKAAFFTYLDMCRPDDL